MAIQVPANSLPSGMIDAYRRIQVALPGGRSARVAVQRYACQHVGYGTGQSERMAIKDRVLGAMGGTRRLAQFGLTASSFVGVFSGKGSMDDIATCLAFMAERRIFHHQRNLPGDDQRPLPDLLQRVADNYLGLDCNGFVGNWAVYNGVTGASVNHYPIDWLTGRTVRRTLAEIQAYDIAVWANGTHIGMVESVAAPAAGATRLTVNFAESSRGGMLNHVGTEISALRTAVETARGHFQAHFSLRNDIHGAGNVVIASMLRR
ncbi:MAG: hypothetical protein JNL19_13610 [Burkholderiales bacterium]|nr:hypothetical protein [Burkholderiales bacterium]